MSEINFNDPNIPLDFTYDTEEVEAEIQRREEEAAKEELLEKQEASKEMESRVNSGEAAGPTIEQSEVEKEYQENQGGFLGGMMEGMPQSYADQGEVGFDSDNMGGKQRVVAGTMDTIMDTLSAVVPALKPADEWWEEKSGRNAGKDPFKKAERDMAAILVPTLVGGAVVSGIAKGTGVGATMSARSKIFAEGAAALGIDALVSGVSDTTRESGNLGSLLEQGMQQVLPGTTIPWASRDSDSPDVIFAKNMLENLGLGTAGELVSAAFALRGGNKITPKNQKAADVVLEKDAKTLQAIEEAGGDPLIATVNRARAKKKAAQLGEGQRVLAEDPEGLNGYNAFVNEPAEPTARLTMDEEANGVDFMADQARIRNNVGTTEGRSRPLINDSDIQALSRADASTRESILAKASDELSAEFSLEVGGQKLTEKQVAQSVNDLYDAALMSDESFDDVVKSFSNAEVNLMQMVDSVADEGSREIMGQTINRLVDAVSPNKQRASAAIQTQAAGSVSDLGRNIDLMDDVVDTSRLQEMIMPRIRTLMKESEVSKVKEQVSKQLRAKYAKVADTVDTDYLDDLYEQFDNAVTAKTAKIDAFVDELEALSKQNPAYLRPLYRMYAKTNGDIDSLFKMNKFVNDRLGVIKKGMYDTNPEFPSLVLKEMQGMRMGNLLNGFAPAKAWVGNAFAIAVKPMTTLAGTVPYAMKGDMKPIQRAFATYSGFMETFSRARKMAREEWRFANANPDAAMARGRKDWNLSEGSNPGSNDWRKTLREYEEFEELSETWDIGKKAMWNLTKGLTYWNRQTWNRWGVHAMYSADGFAKSIMASGNARGKAFDALYQKSNGVIDPAEFKRVEQELYDQTFDTEGVLKDGYAKFASEEIALNADVPALQSFEKMMDTFPVLKGIFMFPTTRVNQFGVLQTYDPVGLLSKWEDRSWKAIKAKTPDEIREVLDMHGMTGATDDEFLQLKSEYIGRKLATSGVVMTGAMLAFNGKLTGAGPWDQAEKRRMMSMGWKPFSINLGDDENPDWRSYENLPIFKPWLSMVADVTNELADADGDLAGSWYQTLASTLTANITNDVFGTEIETLAGLVQGDAASWNKFTAGTLDSLIPGTAVRGALSSTLTPALQDVENNWQSYLANRNRWMPGVRDALSNQIDIFTGEPINIGASPVDIVMGKMLPFFKTNSGREPWREWLISTGWDGMSKPLIDKTSLEELSPEKRQWINKWIGDNANLAGKIDDLRTKNDGWWDKQLKQYAKKRGIKSQKDYPIKQTFVHQYLDDLVQNAYSAAWDAYTFDNDKMASIGALKERRDLALFEGRFDDANDIAGQIDSLRNMPK